MQFGLKEMSISKIQHVFAHYPQIEQAILFGSRAKGNFKTGSDIDLALKGVELTLTVINKLSNEIDDLLLPYSFDLISYSQVNNPELLEHIKRVGIIFYSSEKLNDSHNDKT